MTAEDEHDPDAGGVASAGTAQPGEGGVIWNDAAMRTDFANVVNIQGTREQIELFFGTSRGLSFARTPASAGHGVTVELSHRLILTPHAAKRLQVILARVLDTYESRHGALPVDD